MAGKGYSMNEKKELLQFIIERNGYSETKGRSLWVDYTNTGRTTRTWQSLKEVFLKRILPDIRNPYFNLPQDILQNFRSSFYRSNEMHKDKKILNWKSNKSDTGPSEGQAQNKHCLDSKTSSNSSRHSSSGDRTPTFEEINEVDEVRETANPSPILSISQNNNTVLDSSEKRPDESGDLLSRSTTPDLVINLSDSLKLTPADQAMPDIDGVNPFSNNISLQRDLNCNETPSELIEVVNYLNEAYANETKRQEQLENTDAETTLDLLNVLSDSPEILGETLKAQTQFLTESKALPLNPVLETEATAGESIATQASDDLNHPSLTNLQKLSKVLDDNGVQQSAYLNELSDSAISGILNHVLDTETQSNKKKKLVSKVKAKTSPKKRTLKKSLAKPRGLSPKNKKDKVTQTNFPSPVNSEENCSRSVGVQADTRNAKTVADIPISPSVITHPNESLRGYSPQPGPSGLSNLNGATIPNQDLALVKSTEPPSPTIAYERQISVESAALVHTSPELKRDRLNASELNRIRDKKRKKDLQNLFGFSNGQVKVNHIGETSSRKYPIGVQKPSASRAGHKNTPQTNYSSGDTDCEHRATSSKRRRDSTDASYVEIPTFSEGNLLAMVGGCFYPVYSGVPGNMRVVKWMPKSNGIKMRKSKRILCSSSDSDSDARRRRKTLPKYTRRPATHRSSTPEIVDFPNAQMQKAYCNAVLKYYDGGSRGEAPRIRDYQRVLTHEEARMPKHTNKENRSKVYNISDSDADVVQERQRAADTKQSKLNAVPITVPAVASATHPKDIVAVSPANEDSVWKLVYKMLQRKINQEPVPQPPLLQSKGVMMDSAVSTSDLLTDVESSVASGIAMPESAAQSQRDIVHLEMDPRSPPQNKAKLAAKPRKRRSTLAPRKSPVRRSRSGLKDGKAPGSSPAGAPPVSSALAEGECSRESIGGRESVFLKNSSGEKAHEVKKPKYSVTVQKYGEDLGNYTIENTQQTEIFLDIMKNIRDTISNAAATMNRETANGTSETSAGAVTGIIAKEQEIFEEIKRLQNEEVIELSQETIRSTEDARESASMNGHAPAITEESALVKDAESAPPNAKEISLGKDLSPDVISETSPDIAAKDTASIDETNKHKLSDSSSSLLRKVKKPQGASRIPRARNIRMRKSVRTSVSVSALTAKSSHEPPVVTEEAVTQTTDVVIIAGPEDSKLGNSSSKSISTISQANLAKVKTNAVSRASSDTIGMEVYGVLAQAKTEPTSERVSPISGSTMGSNSSSECALSSIAAADTLDDPQTQMSVTVQTDTRKKKPSKRLSESDAVVRKSSRKSSLFSQPDSAEVPLKKTRNRTSIAGIGASREIQLGHMTRSAVRAVEDASRIGKRSVARK